MAKRNYQPLRPENNTEEEGISGPVKLTATIFSNNFSKPVVT